MKQKIINKRKNSKRDPIIIARRVAEQRHAQAVADYNAAVEDCLKGRP